VACHWFERYSTLGCRPSGSLDDKDEIVRTIQNPEAASVVVINRLVCCVDFAGNFVFVSPGWLEILLSDTVGKMTFAIRESRM